MTSSSQDRVLEALVGQLEHMQGNAIWLAEEQTQSSQLDGALKKRQVCYLSNRIDQVESMQSKGIEAEFHDFEPSLLEGRRFDQIFIRAPKQRSLVHHLLNLAPDILASNGSLYIAGLKSEGIKTHIQRAEERLGSKAQKKKTINGVGLYQVALGSAGPHLADNDYVSLRELELAPEKLYWSKPGIYGWNKVDQGSRLLVEVMRKQYSSLSGKRVLDLGCGYGYLADAAAQLGPKRVVATDNHAGSILAARANLDTRAIDSEVVATDCGAAIKEEFDLILCNPPFHQAFSVTPRMHQKFVEAIAKLLAPQGRALVVINSFLRIDRLCSEVGLQILNRWSFQQDNFTVLELGGRGNS